MTEKNEKCRICVAVGADNVANALAAAKEVEAGADVIEIRLDGLSDPAISPFVKGLKKPLIFTNRPQWEGGKFGGDEDDRYALLLEAAEAGAAYVDMELKSDNELRAKLLAQAKKTGTKVIISWHDFKTTASDRALDSVFQDMYRSGADIAKIVTTARSFHDVLRVLKLQEIAAEMGMPLIAFAMGGPGRISRLATMEMNGFMTYAAVNAAAATAPGQLSLASLNKIIEIWQNGN